MASYTVHLPAGGNPEQARFLDDRVSIAALIVPWLYLLWHRLWFVFGLYCLAAITIALITSSLGPVSGLVLSVLPGLFLFITAKDFVRAKWEENGWPVVATIEAGSLGEAELRYFHAVADPANAPDAGSDTGKARPVALPATSAASVRAPGQGGIGLFD